MKMTVTNAFRELDGIRNNRSDSSESLIARVDAIGKWAAVQKSHNSIFKLLYECHHLRDKLQGGTGKGGTRIYVVSE